MALLKEKIDFKLEKTVLCLYKGEFYSAQNIKQELSSLRFLQNEISMFGKIHPVPRQELWFGSESYIYSGVQIKANAYPVFLSELQEKLMSLSKLKLNSCLVNKYRNGEDYVSWHQDNEPVLGLDPQIVSLSFGEARKFKIRNRENHSDGLDIFLEDGDLLVMQSGSQKYYEHSLPKSKKQTGIRYNLTFRNFLS